MRVRVLAMLLLSGLAVVAQGDAFTERISRAANGDPTTGGSSQAVISRDGRYVAFASRAVNLGSVDGRLDIFRKDLQTGVVVHVSRSGVADSDQDCVQPSISPDGRWIAYISRSTNLVAAPAANGFVQVFVWDAQGPTIGGTFMISANGAAAGNGDSGRPDIANSPIGGQVVFESLATNFAVATTAGRRHIYLWGVGGPPLLVSSPFGFGEGNNSSEFPKIAVDATGSTRIVFNSTATNLVAGDRDLVSDVFLWDPFVGITLVSRNGAVQSALPATEPSISEDGNRIAFLCAGGELTGTTGNGQPQVHVWTRSPTPTLQIVSAVGGTLANGACSTPAISRDGQRIAFGSTATNLGIANPVSLRHVYLHTESGAIRPLSWSDNQVPADQTTGGAHVSGDGTWVVFDSASALLEAGDNNGVTDVFAAFGGVRNLAPAGFGPGIVRPLRPSRLLDRIGPVGGPVGLYRPLLRSIHAEANRTSGCGACFRLTTVVNVGGQSVQYHGTVDAAGNYTPGNDLGPIFGSMTNVVGMATADDGKAIVVVTDSSTMTGTRSSTTSTFGVPCTNTGIIGSVGQIALDTENGVVTRMKIYYRTAAGIESQIVCLDPTGTCYGCQYCSPPCGPPTLETNSLAIGQQVPPRTVVISTTVVPTPGTVQYEGDWLVFGREGTIGGIYHITGRTNPVASTIYLVQGLTFSAGAGVQGRTFAFGSDRRLWEFECLAINSAAAPAASGGVATFTPRLPPTWFDHLGFAGVVFGFANAPAPNPPFPLLGTPQAFLFFVQDWHLFGPGQQRAFSLPLPGGWPQIDYRVQVGYLSAQFGAWGGNVSRLSMY